MLSLENRRNLSQLENEYPSPTSSYSDEESVSVCIHRVTEGWVRCWNNVSSTHYWKNKNTQEITYDNPFFFKNDNGSVSIHGFLYIQGVDITKAVKIDKLSVIFSKELVDAQKISFNPPEVEITSMLNNDDIYDSQI